MERELTPEEQFELAIGPSVRKEDLPEARTIPHKEKLLDADDAFLGSTKPPRKKPVDHNARTVLMMERAGWVYVKAQSYNAFSGTSKDLFGFLDYIALAPGRCIGVQVCRKADSATHITKAKKVMHEALTPQTKKDEAWAHRPKRSTLVAWLQAGCEFQVWGWELRSDRWFCERRLVTLDSDGNVSVAITENDPTPADQAALPLQGE